MQKELNESARRDHWDVVSYDAVRLVADAVKRGGPQAAGYLKAMAATKIDLVLGQYEFDENREIKPEGLDFLFFIRGPSRTAGIEVVRTIADVRSMLIQIGVNGLVLAGDYALVAVGLTLIFGVMRMVNFARVSP